MSVTASERRREIGRLCGAARRLFLRPGVSGLERFRRRGYSATTLLVAVKILDHFEFVNDGLEGSAPDDVRAPAVLLSARQFRRHLQLLLAGPDPDFVRGCRRGKRGPRVLRWVPQGSSIDRTSATTRLSVDRIL